MSRERKLRGIRRRSSTPFQFQHSRDVTSSGTGLKICTHAQEGCCQLPRKGITDWSITFPFMDMFTELFEQPSYIYIYTVYPRIQVDLTYKATPQFLQENFNLSIFSRISLSLTLTGGLNEGLVKSLGQWGYANLR